MKLSIITVTYNSDKTLVDTLNSVASQNYKNIEHIFVDGGSTDNTLSLLREYPFKKKKIYYKKNYGIYKSINFGISKASGEFITVLNSDDFYHSNNQILKVVKKIEKNKKYKIFFGNIVYFNHFNYYNIKRYYNVERFKPWHMKLGLMPAHPASFIHKDIYKRITNYNESFKIASDFDFFLKTIFIKKIPYKILNQTVVRMRTGGISDQNWLSYVKTTKEILESFRINALKTSLLSVILRIPLKLHQLFFFNEKLLNKDFEIYKIISNKKTILSKSIKVIDGPRNIPFNQNFILSGLNLAFLGYLYASEISLKINLINWLDGLWAEKFINLKKKPGREILNKLKLPKNINEIVVVGNLSKKSLKYLKKKFKIKVSNIALPYKPINQLKKIKLKIKNSKKKLILITLPTPKQEQLADYISTQNKNYKIICIGASLAIASGEEKAVPLFLKNYEFLWRLRSDTLRRSTRLIQTMYYYIKGSIFYNKFNQIPFRKF